MGRINLAAFQNTYTSHAEHEHKNSVEMGSAEEKENQSAQEISTLLWSNLFPLNKCRQYVTSKKPGVYEIYRKTSDGKYQVLYVGSSGNVRSRLHQHAELKGGNKQLTTAIVTHKIENFYARWVETSKKDYQDTEEALIIEHGFGDIGLYIYNKTASTKMGRKRLHSELEEDEEESSDDSVSLEMESRILCRPFQHGEAKLQILGAESESDTTSRMKLSDLLPRKLKAV